MQRREEMRQRITSGILLELLLASMLAFIHMNPLTIHPVEAEGGQIEAMPDFGQHSMNWCWVAAAANCFYWRKYWGDFPGLYPDSWDSIDPQSINASNDDWFCPCGNGYSTLLKEICKDGDAVHEESLIFCSQNCKLAS